MANVMFVLMFNHLTYIFCIVLYFVYSLGIGLIVGNTMTCALSHLTDNLQADGNAVIYKKLKFEKFNSDDIKEILTELTDLKFKDDAIEYLATRTNQFRQLVKLINKIEKLMKTNQIEELDEYTMKGLLNARPDINANIKAMQTIG